MSAIDPDEMLAIMTVGARLAPEKSRALPAASYRDPAETVKLAGDIRSVRKAKGRPPKVNKKWR
jgi:hypothetical protein